MKKNRLNYLLVILFIIIGLKNPVQAQENQNQNSLLWEISGNELENPSYLFGTIHMIPKKDYFFTKLMKEKFNDCSILVLEIDINIPIKTQIDLVKKMFIPDNKTLKDYLNEDEYKRFSAYILDSLKLKESKLKRYIRIKPFFSMGLILKDKIKKIKMYEKELNKLAKKNKMKLTELETIDFQMSIIEKISIEDQVSMIFKDSESNNFNLLAEFYELLEVYEEQNVFKLYELMKEEEEFALFEKDFFIDRHENWIPKIENLIREQSAFIAIGAGHLAGEKGVINLLRNKGYVVNPVLNDF